MLNARSMATATTQNYDCFPYAASIEGLNSHCIWSWARGAHNKVGTELGAVLGPELGNSIRLVAGKGNRP
jgi:hypothetical protein